MTLNNSKEKIEDKIKDICQHVGDYTYNTMDETLRNLISLVESQTLSKCVEIAKSKKQEPDSPFLRSCNAFCDSIADEISKLNK